MIEIALPVLRATDIVAATLEQAELSGSPVWVVTVREGFGSLARRRWYHDPAEAMAFAAEEADRHGLTLLDLRDPGDA